VLAENMADTASWWLSEHMNHLQIIHGDVMKVQLPFFDVCVANLPYQVRLFHLWTHPDALTGW